MGSPSRSRSRSGDEDSRSPSPAPKGTKKRESMNEPEERRDSDDSDRKIIDGKEGKVNGESTRNKRSRSRSRSCSPRNKDRLAEMAGDDERDRSPRVRSRSNSGSPEEETRRKKATPQRADLKRDEASKESRGRSRSPRGDNFTSKSPSRSRSRSGSRSKNRRSRRTRSRSYSPRGRDDIGNHDFGYRLHVADLDMGATKQDLESVFGKFGPLKEIWMARSVPCFAFVVYRYKEDADEAVRKTDGVDICGRRIRVSNARPRTRGMGRRGFDPGMKCYQCGDRGHFSRDCPDSKYGYKRPPSPRGGRYFPRNDRFDDRRDRGRDRRY